MVQIGEHAVDLVSVWIPPGEERQLGEDSCHLGDAAGNHAIYSPHGCCDEQYSDASPYHRLGVYQFGVSEEHGYHGDGHISQHDPFQCQESFLRVFLYLEIIFYHTILVCWFF